MKSDNLGFAETLTITATRLPGGKFSIRSGTSQIETAILAIGCSLVIFRESQAHHTVDPGRVSRTGGQGTRNRRRVKRVPGRLCVGTLR